MVGAIRGTNNLGADAEPMSHSEVVCTWHSAGTVTKNEFRDVHYRHGLSYFDILYGAAESRTSPFYITFCHSGGFIIRVPVSESLMRNLPKLPTRNPKPENPKP